MRVIQSTKICLHTHYLLQHYNKDLQKNTEYKY